MGLPSSEDPERPLVLISRWLYGIALAVAAFPVVAFSISLSFRLTHGDIVSALVAGFTPASFVALSGYYITKRKDWAVMLAMILLAVPRAAARVGVALCLLFGLIGAANHEFRAMAGAFAGSVLFFALSRFLQYLQRLLLDADAEIARTPPRVARGFEPIMKSSPPPTDGDSHAPSSQE